MRTHYSVLCSHPLSCNCHFPNCRMQFIKYGLEPYLRRSVKQSNSQTVKRGGERERERAVYQDATAVQQSEDRKSDLMRCLSFTVLRGATNDRRCAGGPDGKTQLLIELVADKYLAASAAGCYEIAVLL